MVVSKWREGGKEKKGSKKGKHKEKKRKGGENKKGRIDSSLSFQDILPKKCRAGNDLL